jgi:hypothetical protein
MKRRMIVAVAVAVVLAGGVAFTQSQGRVVQERYPFEVKGDLIADCSKYGVGDFRILTDYAAEVHDATLLGQDGLPIQLVENFKCLWSRYYSPETGKEVKGGPGESQQMRMLFENGLPVSHRWSGAVFKIVVPGYGPILLETGRARWIWDAAGTAHWLDTNSGHNMWVDRDLTALCNYLK